MAETSTTPPSKLFLLLEGRALYEFATGRLAKPWLRDSPRGDGHSVMVLPGFLASGLSTQPLRKFLDELGYDTHCWGLGRNLGLRQGLEERMIERLQEVHSQTGNRVSLVGWSLGGVFSRFLASFEPELVRQVITLGSPFNGDPKANHSWRLFELTSGTKLEDIDQDRYDRIKAPLDVPATSIFSRSDGIAAWQCCISEENDISENVEVRGSHCGLGVNPLVLHVIADRLSQSEGQWRRFQRDGLRRYFYQRPISRQEAYS